jgi:endoglucanase
MDDRMEIRQNSAGDRLAIVNGRRKYAAADSGEDVLASPGMSRLMSRCALIGILLVAAACAGCRQGPWSLWHAYADGFMDVQGRVIDRSAGDRSTSEGQAYAMFFALADNDRSRFDRLLTWTQNNLADGDLGTRLPGWLWGRTPTGEWKVLDANPASDADCWMAYSLIEAGRLWKNEGYATLGRQMMGMIAKQEVAELPGFGPMLMPGTTALFVHNQTWTVNPSYVPMFLFQRFNSTDPSGPWGEIAMNIPRLLRDSSRRGFAMDWVNFVAEDGFVPAPGPRPAQPVTPVQPAAKADVAAAGQSTAAKPVLAAANPAAADPPPTTGQTAAPAAKPPMGSYDAIRVYLWAGMTDRANGAQADLMAAIPGMGKYVAQNGVPPEQVDADGIPMKHPGPVGFSAALLPYLWAAPDLARAAAQQRVRMAQQVNASTGLYGKDPVYYDQNLVLFATGYLDRRFRFGPHGELKVEWTR